MGEVTENVADPLPSWYQPTAQVATGLLFADEAGRVLLVKPTYNDVWHLPGGVVEAGESPAAAAVREVREELGLDVKAGRLMGVDYRHPTPGGRGGALRFVFDGGALTSAQIADIVLPADEIREWRYVSVDELDDYVIPVLANRLRHMLAGHVYLEEGRPVTYPRAP
jgi:8-oxo-dGTP pyrophosphatase MutT (NUDIX family)